MSNRPPVLTFVVRQQVEKGLPHFLSGERLRVLQALQQGCDGVVLRLAVHRPDALVLGQLALAQEVQDVPSRQRDALKCEAHLSHRRNSPKVGAVAVDEEASVGVARDLVAPAEHGGQHGVVVAAQRGQPGGEVGAPHVQRDHLGKLYKGNKKRVAWLNK